VVLLEWMRSQDFGRVRGELLETLEGLLVLEHAAVHRDLLGEEWSPPRAYRWMRYESPDPVRQLLLATRRLAAEWAAAAGHPAFPGVRAGFEAEERRRLGRALEQARALGYGAEGG
jgi:hypothetical protein